MKTQTKSDDDLLLLPFLEHRYPDLDDADKAAYRALIEEEVARQRG